MHHLLGNFFQMKRSDHRIAFFCWILCRPSSPFLLRRLPRILRHPQHCSLKCLCEVCGWTWMNRLPKWLTNWMTIPYYDRAPPPCSSALCFSILNWKGSYHFWYFSAPIRFVRYACICCLLSNPIPDWIKKKGVCLC